MSHATLSDLTIVECAESVAGPYCSKLLADLGANVTKVEPPGGDVSRRAGPFPGDIPHHERSGQFVYLNANKRGVTLNLEAAQGRDILHALLRTADILIVDLPRRRLAELELDYEHLGALNDQLIMTCISPFGQTGPYRDYSGTALTAHMSSGIGYESPTNQVTDLPSQPPLAAGNPQADYTTGLSAATDTMIAVFHRTAYGRGQMVDVSAQEASANYARLSFSTLTHTPDAVPGRARSGFEYAAPCKDGYVFLTPYTLDHWWQRFKDIMGNPGWAETEAFATAEQRIANFDVIEPLVHEWTRQRTKREVYELTLESGIACFPVNSMQDMLEAPQYVYRDYLVETEHPVAGKFVQPGAPVRYSETEWAIRRPAPLLGEHNSEVLCGELGYSREELVTLYQAGVL